MKPKIVVIIGSSKFKDQQLGHTQVETLDGNIVLVTGFWHHVDMKPITSQQKDEIDQLTMRKIDIADEVLVVNKNGYIGESTLEQIDYAKALKKPIRYTVPL